MEKIKKKLILINTDMKKCEEDLMSLNKEVDKAMGDKNRFADYLWRVFRKVVKVAKHTESQEEGDDGILLKSLLRLHLILKQLLLGTEEEEETATPSQISQTATRIQFQKSKGRLDLDVCPEHLDKGIYDKIVKLRVKRLTIVKEMENNKRTGEQASAEYVEVEKMHQKYQERLTQINEEFRILRNRRQKRLNDLKLMIILRADQIQYRFI
jgi:hypothetical protein